MVRATTNIQILVAVIITCCIAGCESPHTQSEALPRSPAASPSGKYFLVVLQAHDDQFQVRQFEILKKMPYRPDPVVFFSTQRFRTFETLIFMWGDNDSVWVYSGDVGVYRWVHVGNDKWKKKDYHAGDPGAPETIRKLISRYI